MNKARIVVLCALIALCSCKKKASDSSGVTFNNHLNKQVALTIYPSMTDYANGTNVLSRKTVKGGEILTLPGDMFVAGRTYYMDWYTDDMYTNNWFNDAYPQLGSQVAFKSVAAGNSFYFDERLNGYSRKVFLANNDLFSNWHAVNAYLYSPSTGYKSQWNNMTEYDRYRQMKVNKSFQAEYSYKDASGTLSTDMLDFKVQYSDEAYIEFVDSKGRSAGSMATGILPTGQAPDYKSIAKDTVLAVLPNSEYYFMMIRD